jgi:hypothetical protein
MYCKVKIAFGICMLLYVCLLVWGAPVVQGEVTLPSPITTSAPAVSAKILGIGASGKRVTLQVQLSDADGNPVGHKSIQLTESELAELQTKTTPPEAVGVKAWDYFVGLLQSYVLAHIGDR